MPRELFRGAFRAHSENITEVLWCSKRHIAALTQITRELIDAFYRSDDLLWLKKPH